MSRSRTKELRKAFEKQNGWSEIHRQSELYKTGWRRFKTMWKRGQL